jgi:hypothetical protein
MSDYCGACVNKMKVAKLHGSVQYYLKNPGCFALAGTASDFYECGKKREDCHSD